MSRARIIFFDLKEYNIILILFISLDFSKKKTSEIFNDRLLSFTKRQGSNETLRKNCNFPYCFPFRKNLHSWKLLCRSLFSRKKK